MFSLFWGLRLILSLIFWMLSWILIGIYSWWWGVLVEWRIEFLYLFMMMMLFVRVFRILFKGFCGVVVVVDKELEWWGVEEEIGFVVDFLIRGVFNKLGIWGILNEGFLKLLRMVFIWMLICLWMWVKWVLLFREEIWDRVW